MADDRKANLDTGPNQFRQADVQVVHIPVDVTQQPIINLDVQCVVHLHMLASFQGAIIT